jgi:hypothetical protein
MDISVVIVVVRVIVVIRTPVVIRVIVVIRTPVVILVGKHIFVLLFDFNT